MRGWRCLLVTLVAAAAFASTADARAPLALRVHALIAYASPNATNAWRQKASINLELDRGMLADFVTDAVLRCPALPPGPGGSPLLVPPDPKQQKLDRQGATMFSFTFYSAPHPLEIWHVRARLRVSVYRSSRSVTFRANHPYLASVTGNARYRVVFNHGRDSCQETISLASRGKVIARPIH